MTLSCTIEFEYASKEKAEAVLNAISPDNSGFVDAHAEGTRLTVRSSSETPMQMLHTMEDLLACMKIAEETFDLTSG